MVTTLTSVFEGALDHATETDELRATRAPVTFDLDVDRRNQGVMLRRTSDQAESYQAARVYVDGTDAGMWLQPLGRWCPFADDEPPPPVVRLSAEAVQQLGSNSVRLSWDRADDNVGVEHYEVFASTDPEFAASPDALIGMAPVTGYTHAGLGLDETWHYRVRAVDGAGHVGALSERVPVTTPPDHLREVETSVVLGETNQASGLNQADAPDGVTEAVQAAGRSARRTVEGGNPTWGRYKYFGIDDAVVFDGDYAAVVTVEYLDQGNDTFTVEYDSSDTDGPVNGTFTLAGEVAKTDTGQWLTASFALPEARFANRQQGAFDFRLGAEAGDEEAETIHRVDAVVRAR